MCALGGQGSPIAMGDHPPISPSLTNTVDKRSLFLPRSPSSVCEGEQASPSIPSPLASATKPAKAWLPLLARGQGGWGAEETGRRERGVGDGVQFRRCRAQIRPSLGWIWCSHRRESRGTATLGLAMGMAGSGTHWPDPPPSRLEASMPRLAKER